MRRQEVPVSVPHLDLIKSRICKSDVTCHLASSAQVEPAGTGQQKLLEIWSLFHQHEATLDMGFTIFVDMLKMPTLKILVIVFRKSTVTTFFLSSYPTSNIATSSQFDKGQDKKEARIKILLYDNCAMRNVPRRRDRKELERSSLKRTTLTGRSFIN